MDKTEYFLKQSEIYYNNKFYPDAVSRRYYALLHLMVDKIEHEGASYERRHDKIRKAFVEQYYPQEMWTTLKDRIYRLYSARCNADYVRSISEQFTDEKHCEWYEKINDFIEEIKKTHP